jgi:16S rRNA (guanine527-N7)-methyltransferase
VNTNVPGPQSPLPPSLTEFLVQARAWGFLGDGPLDVHVAHAQGFADAAEAVATEGPDSLSGSIGRDSQLGPWLDLGSGGGIPGLVLAHRWADSEAVLLESNERRARFLVEAVESQGWTDRIRVVPTRAELAGRDGALRGSFALVVARSFGPPPVTAECAAPFLRCGGLLIVSEPPSTEPPGTNPAGSEEDVRWPAKGLADLGLEPLTRWRDEFGYRVLRQVRECPDRFPRRVGVPAKRPLYRVG